MHLYLRVILLCAGSCALVACGQSGALQLPSDPKLDQRAQYLLYTPKQSPRDTVTPVPQAAERTTADQTP